MSDSPVTALKALVSDIAEELEGVPTLGGLVEILGWSAPPYVAVPPAYKIALHDSKRYKKPADAIAGELSDAIFADAAVLMTRIAPLDDEGDPKIATQRLDAALSQLLRDSDIEFRDVRGSGVAGVTLAPTKRAARPRPGTVLAIPAAGGGYRLASVITRNHFGTALGIVDGVVTVPSAEAAAGRPVLPRPFYTDDRAVANGVWRVIGHDDALRERFPQNPEIYHRSPSPFPGMNVGEFGAAETADGAMRLIDAAEAREVGLGTDYQQVLMSEELQAMLDKD
jgi:hypothetical protein